MGAGEGMGGDAMGGMMPPSDPGGMPMPSRGGRMAMHMTFFWGKRVEILFSGWPGDRGVGMYLLALLFVFVASALVDYLSSISRRLSRGPAATPGDRRVSTAVLLTTLHAVRLGLAYLVMLAVMSFNVGVLIVAIAGHAVGFLVSGAGLSKGDPSNEPADPTKSMYS
ncbi:copper transporter 6-like [Phoenix dactylifera]|uniref:Copper transport protein n=1 Tax=Phoenix dactylifera TaxID=42345 RepID=A0A8B7BU44_PHODC|nr:copper transporter 6-like [Phoenix dactylifera]